MPTAYATAFISVSPSRGFYPRLTRPLHSAAHVLHCKGAECDAWCSAFRSADADVPARVTISEPWGLSALRRLGAGGRTQPWQLFIPNLGKTMDPQPLFSVAACNRALRSGRTYLPFRERKQIKCTFPRADGDNAALERAFAPDEQFSLMRRLRRFSSSISW